MAHQFWITSGYHPPSGAKHSSGDETPPIPEEELEQQKIEYEQQLQKEKECQAREAEEVRKLDIKLLRQRAIKAEEEHKRLAESSEEFRGMNTSWSHHRLSDLQRQATRWRHSRPSIPDTTKPYRSVLKKSCSAHAQLTKPQSSQSIMSDSDGIFINMSRLGSCRDESGDEIECKETDSQAAAAAALGWRASANDVSPHSRASLVKTPSCPGSRMRRVEMQGDAAVLERLTMSRSASSVSRCTPHTPLGQCDSVSVSSNPMLTIYRCRAPIASLDCMDDFSANSQQMLDQVSELSISNKPMCVGTQTAMPTATPGLRYRSLGKSGLRVPNIGLGLWSMPEEDYSEEIIMTALDNGINLFDLSEAHCAKGEAELGKILKKRNVRRSGVIITTKIYWSTKSDERGLSRKHIVESVKASLTRLQVDYIDVVLLHKVDPICPMEELVRAMHFVISQGWVMYWGTARWTPSEIMDAYTNCRQFNCISPVVEQTEYHMFCREKPELYMPELYHKIGVGMMAWSAITTGKGLGREEPVTHLFAKSRFNRKYSTFSWCEEPEVYTGPEMQSETSKELVTNEAEARSYGDKLKDLANFASSLNCTMGQLAVAWCLKNESVNCLLLGATSVEQLRENIHALQIVPQLTSLAMAEIERLLANRPQRPPMVSTLAMRNQHQHSNTLRLDMAGATSGVNAQKPEGEEVESPSSKESGRGFCEIQ